MTHPLRKYRAENEITLGELAKRAGTSKSTLSRIENGLQPTTEATIRRLIAASGGKLTANDFIGAGKQVAAMIDVQTALIGHVVAFLIGGACGAIGLAIAAGRHVPAARASHAGRPLEREEDPTEHGPFTVGLPTGGFLFSPGEPRIPTRPVKFDRRESRDAA